MIFMRADVLLLADVFETFINTCLEYYGLDPCYYFSGPGFKLRCNASNDWDRIRAY